MNDDDSSGRKENTKLKIKKKKKLDGKNTSLNIQYIIKEIYRFYLNTINEINVYLKIVIINLLLK